jgi:dimethylargininase
MSWKFRHALVRPPARSFAQGLTSAGQGPPDVNIALAQHAAYCSALRQCGVEVRILAADERFPDSTFVEDTAILAERAAIATLPGAPSRVGEVASIAAALAEVCGAVHRIVAPGSVDGGDICQADEHFFIGLSARTNSEGARQLSGILRAQGYTVSTIDIRNNRKLLHLKSGISYLGERRLVLCNDFPQVPEFSGYQLLRVVPEEGYAANCVRINEHVLIATGYTRFADALGRLKLATIALDMSEFRKMDGGLSCLSLRYDTLPARPKIEATA